MAEGNTTQIRQCLDLLQVGDEKARDALIQHSCERLMRLTRKMLKGYPRLRRWEQTDDVLQNALLRLHRSLADVKPESVPQFLPTFRKSRDEFLGGFRVRRRNSRAL